jgi:predicted transcriptional regulator
MTTTTAHSIAVTIDPETKDRIKRLADARHRTQHWVVREAISQYVEREEKQESMRRDAVQAWEEYEQTGAHATAKEVDEWLAQLEQGQDAEPPECHG